ncbi:HEAT repeat-containing protein [Striga asiatica]|uniref:HEAT repeat-containing protein n=1 Tax=Striga asiatica TaxID=4170 RepID=A0A5A7Q0H2_STRAF|nr:HEAT repeat-containing protein [Striga asiatica]
MPLGLGLGLLHAQGLGAGPAGRLAGPRRGLVSPRQSKFPTALAIEAFMAARLLLPDPHAVGSESTVELFSIELLGGALAGPVGMAKSSSCVSPFGWVASGLMNWWRWWPERLKLGNI